MGPYILFLKKSFGEGVMMIRSTSIFLEHWVLPNISTSFDPILSNEKTHLLPTFLVYIHGS
jgi:hypothetical protein